MYATFGDLQARLGQAGVALRVADNPQAASMALDQASGWIDEALLPRYGAQLSNSRWVKNACANLAMVPFCQSLLNDPPPAAFLEYDRLMGQNGQPGVLESMRLGQTMVPDIPAVASSVPRLTNYHVREVPQGAAHVVAEPARSTDGVTPQVPRRDYTDPLRWQTWDW